MRLERDIVRFFRATGPNYQAKMARVLKAWMHGRLAKAVMGPDTTDIALRPETVETQINSIPYWGEEGATAGVQQFLNGYTFAQDHMLALENGEARLSSEEFQAALMEAALEG